MTLRPAHFRAQPSTSTSEVIKAFFSPVEEVISNRPEEDEEEDDEDEDDSEAEEDEVDINPDSLGASSPIRRKRKFWFTPGLLAITTYFLISVTVTVPERRITRLNIVARAVSLPYPWLKATVRVESDYNGRVDLSTKLRTGQFTVAALELDDSGELQAISLFFASLRTEAQRLNPASDEVNTPRVEPLDPYMERFNNHLR